MTTLHNDEMVVTRPNTRRKVPVVVSAADLIPTKVDWLWERYIPRGAITILDGDPGLGKSTLTVDLAARVTRGSEMPPVPAGSSMVDPAGVLFLNAEDDPARTIRPRLDAAGADVARVRFLTDMENNGATWPPVLPDDLDAIEDNVGEMGAAMVIIDPLMAYLTGSVDANKDAHVRRVLHRVKDMAQRTGAAV